MFLFSRLEELQSFEDGERNVDWKLVSKMLHISSLDSVDVLSYVRVEGRELTPYLFDFIYLQNILGFSAIDCSTFYVNIR